MDGMMPKSFQSDRTPAAAALQAYLILIGRAANHQTIQYGELAERMHHGADQFLAGLLGRIMRWCAHEGLPSLTSLVIAQEPSHDAQSDLSAKRQFVFDFDWYSIFPPSLDELELHRAGAEPVQGFLAVIGG